jgi:hypothetical protein
MAAKSLLLHEEERQANENLGATRTQLLESTAWAMATMGNDMKASDPRDLVYGLLVITGIGVEPDYSKILAEVNCDVCAAWMGSNSNGFGRLGSLNYGGLSRGLCHDCLNIPSWCPQFDAERDGKDAM